MPRSIVAALILGGALLFAATIPVLSFVRQDVDYEAVYAQGTAFADFLEKARAHREEWRANYNDATVSASLVTRMRALPAKRHLLVVAEDWCSDSLNTVPYIARLVDGGAERLDMRVVNREIGKAVMEAHRTPDGRTATPTIAILDEDWHLLSTWTERPSSVQAWFLEKQKTTMQKPLHDELLAWYQNDAGKTTILEIAGLLER
ncbi:MAG TPA: thioredoxin family protein [Vicinamibacterales bacterium]|nr:thioredoxin family protein [Vicinamibacterales bacterium]